MVLDRTDADVGHGLNVWGRTFAGAGSNDGGHDRDSRDFSQRFAGVVFGTDYVDENHISYGMTFAYHQASLGVSQETEYGDALTNSYAFAVKASAPFLAGGHFGGDVFYMVNDTQVRRQASTTGPISHPDGKNYGAALQADYSFGDLTPQIRIGYVHASRDGTTETNIGSPIVVASRGYDSFRTDIAVRYRHDFDLEDDMVLSPEVTIGAEGELMSSGRTSRVRLETGSNWVVPDYAKPNAAAFLFGLDTSLRVGSQTAFYIKADGRSGNRSREGVLSIGGRYTF